MAVKQVDPEVTKRLSAISVYEREFKRWEGRVEKILKRYRDEQRQKDSSGSRFNILWSNIQTAIPATFSRLPQPDVSRRFKDTDPVGRVAALLLERGLEYEIEHYADYRASLKQCVHDRFLGGRGVTWVRYEPHMQAKAQPEDGDEITEDTDTPEVPEVLEYECAPADYVHWKDFGHTIARTWEEVTAVWRKVYMGRAALVERFGEEIGGKVPLDTRPDEPKKVMGTEGQEYEALVYEIWDKSSGEAIWLSKSLSQILDKKGAADLPKFENFWPCPRPLYATLTNESLVPVPDFSLYQDQAATLDVLADRIDGLVKMLQVKGCYDAATPELARLFTEGENGTLLPVKNWAAFAEKQGLKGSIAVNELQPIYDALKVCYEAVEQQKNQIYEITGLADVIRGQSDPRETAEAVKTKGAFGSMRLRSMQADVAQFATEILQLKAQVICSEFDPQTIAAIGGANTLREEDQQYVQQAIQLLKSANLRDFRIEIVADSMIYMDEVQEKQDRMELLQASGTFIQKVAEVANPQLAPLLLEMLKFGVTGFKVGKTIEGVFDQVADQLKQEAAKPQPPKQDPEILKIQAEGQMKSQELQQKAEYDKFKAGLDAQVAKAQQEAQAQQDAQAQQMEAAREQQKMHLQAQLEQHKASLEAQKSAQELDFKRYEAELKARTAIAVAEIGAKATLAAAQLKAAQAEATGGAIEDKQPETANADVQG